MMLKGNKEVETTLKIDNGAPRTNNSLENERRRLQRKRDKVCQQKIPVFTLNARNAKFVYATATSPTLKDAGVSNSVNLKGNLSRRIYLLILF